jgi:hypothetical protein
VSSKLLRIALGCLVAAALAVVGWIVHRRLAPQDDSYAAVARAEAALAGPDHVALAFADVALLRGLLPEASGAAGEVDFDALLLHPLGLRGVALALDVSRAVVAVSPGPEVAVALFGRFDPAAIAAAVRAQPDASVREQERDGDRVLRVARVDAATCVETVVAIALRGDRIVLAPDASLETLLDRLDAPSEPAGDGDWLRGLRGFEGEPVLRVSLTHPDRLAALADEPASRALLGAVERLLGGAIRARLEARTRGLGSGLGVVLEVARTDAAEWAQRWGAFRDASRAEWARVAPAAQAWLDALEISADDDVLRASGARGAEAARELPELPDALALLAARDFRGPTPEPSEPPDAGVGPIEVDPRPAQFMAEHPLTRLRPYSPDVPLAGAADVVAGPFGLRVERAARSAESPAPLEVAIRAVGPLLPNLPRPDDAPRLVIDSASDEGGRSLLREERCGAERNGAAARLVAEPLTDFLEATKTVRLVPEATLDSVVRIGGRVEVDLPTRTASVRVPAALGATLESDGVAVEIVGAAPDGFAYRVRGDAARVIHVRGLDVDRRPLAAREAFELPRLAGDGRIGGRRHSGGLASVEAIFAIETQAAVFPFALSSARPGSDGEEQHVESSSFIRYTRDQYEAEFGASAGAWPQDRRAIASATAGPFSVGLDGLEQDEGVAARLTVLAPNVPNLSYHATGLEVGVTGVVLEDGRAAAPADEARAAARALLNARRQFGRAEVEARARLATGLAESASRIARLDGELVLRIPREVVGLELSSVEPGLAVVSGDARVALAELGRDRLALRMTGPLERFFSVRAFAADGHELAVEETQVPSPASPGPHEIRFAVHGRPARLAVQLVRGHDERRYAFQIRLGGGVPASPPR